MHRYCFLLCCFCCLPYSVCAQDSPTEIRHAAMNAHALRYYPFETEADAIVRKIIENGKEESAGNSFARYDVYQKTAIDWVIDGEYLEFQLRNSGKGGDPLFQRLIRPYLPWLEYVRPQKKDSKYLALTTALYDDYFTCYIDSGNGKENRTLRASQGKDLYEIIGTRNIRSALDDALKDVCLYEEKNEILFRFLPGPLNEKNKGAYRYFLSGRKTENGENQREIAFFMKNPQTPGFEGFLYVTDDDRRQLRKAVFAVSASAATNFVEDLLFVQQFNPEDTISLEKRCSIVLGSNVKGCIRLTRTSYYSAQEEVFGENYRSEMLTSSEKQLENVVKTAAQTQAFRNTENLLYLLMTRHLMIGGKDGLFEWGDVTQALSHNPIEGLRFKVGGNTTMNLNDRLLVGGYGAYGLKDRQFKYRGDLIYSFSPKKNSIWEYPRSLLSFTYVNDLNVPGHDLLTDGPDNIFRLVAFRSRADLIGQKIGLVAFEQEIPGGFSFKLEGKYRHDSSKGSFRYNDLTASELNLSFRYASRENFIQKRDKRYFLRRKNFEVSAKHQIGLKGIFGSEYAYHITGGSIYKKINLPQNAGKAEIELSGGKAWSRLPFPLLPVFYGDESYLFDEKNYNLMASHEFVSDRFVAGKVNFRLNWSPVRLLAPRNKIQTSIGARMLYGPLSDANNPDLHPGLFPFGEGIKPLSKDPYIEMNIGLARIFKIFRIEYVRRFTYLNQARKGSLFVTIDIDI